MSTVQQKSKCETISSQQSLVLVKNMFRLSLSSICFLRGIFPGDCFSTKDYAGVKVHQLECAEKDKNGQLIVFEKDAFLLTQWLERGVFEALEQSYLKCLTFSVYKRNVKSKKNSGTFTPKVLDDDILLECYNFGIEYTNGVVTLNGAPFTRETLKKQAVTFIRCLVEFSNTLESLPEERYLTMRMTYYDDKTPLDYQPEFFQEGHNAIKFISKPVKVRVGSLKTPYLTMDLKFAGLDSYDIMDEQACHRQASESSKQAEVEAAQLVREERKKVHEKNHEQLLKQEESPSELEWTADEAAVAGRSLSKPTAPPKVVQLGQQLSSSSLHDLVEDNANDDKESDGTYQKLKAFVLKTQRSRTRECAHEFGLELTQVNSFFRRLMLEGILAQHGTHYRFPSLSSNRSTTLESTNTKFAMMLRDKCGQSDAHQSWKDGQQQCDGDDNDESVVSRDLLAKETPDNVDCDVAALYTQRSCDSIVFTSSPITSPPVPDGRRARLLPRAQSVPAKTASATTLSVPLSSARQQQQPLFHAERGDGDSKVKSKGILGYGCLDLTSRSNKVCSDQEKNENGDDEMTVGFVDDVDAHQNLADDDARPDHANENKRKEGESIEAGQKSAKTRRRISTIADPIYQQRPSIPGECECDTAAFMSD